MVSGAWPGDVASQRASLGPSPFDRAVGESATGLFTPQRVPPSSGAVQGRTALFCPPSARAAAGGCTSSADVVVLHSDVSVEEVAMTSESRTLTRQQEELVALGASVGLSCSECFDPHAQAARAAGLSDDDVRAAVTSAESVAGAVAAELLHRIRSSRPRGIAYVAAAVGGLAARRTGRRDRHGRPVGHRPADAGGRRSRAVAICATTRSPGCEQGAGLRHRCPSVDGASRGVGDGRRRGVHYEPSMGRELHVRVRRRYRVDRRGAPAHPGFRLLRLKKPTPRTRRYAACVNDVHYVGLPEGPRPLTGPGRPTCVKVFLALGSPVGAAGPAVSICKKMNERILIIDD